MWNTDRMHLGPHPPSDGNWVPGTRGRDLRLRPGDLVDVLAEEGTPRDLIDGVAQVVHAERRTTLVALKTQLARAGEDPQARLGLLRAFLKVMREGEFRPLDEPTYHRATDERFLVDVPARVQWSTLDTAWLEEARADPDLRAALETLALPKVFGDRALYFFRGLRPLEIRGWYPSSKVDLLIVNIVRAPFSLLRRLFRRRPVPSNPPGVDFWVRRVGLDDTPWWAGLLQPATLVEPCFSQVVLMYREAGADGGLTIKLFRDIPLADAEMVFPNHRIGLRTLDGVLMLGTGIAAVPAILRALGEGGGTAIALAAALGGYAAKLVGQYTRQRRQHRARLTETLYAKSQDTDVGVLQYLVDAAQTQTSAEIGLAYHHLSKHGPSTASDLDARIEGWLLQRFGGAPRDYDVQEALAGAARFGLIHQTENGAWTAVESPVARRAIAERWSELAPGL